MPTNLNHKDPINTELENLEKEQETVESVISGLKKLTIKVGNSTKKLVTRTTLMAIATTVFTGGVGSTLVVSRYSCDINKWANSNFSVSVAEECIKPDLSLINNRIDGMQRPNNINIQSDLIEIPKTGGLETTGPQGDKGDKGDTGEQGPQGIEGKVGSFGITGRNGVDGKDGVKGEQGIQGLQGLIGQNGSNGNIGATGPQGSIGLTGATGSQGIQGIPGSNTGIVGPQGIQGIAGLQGLTGLTGAAGPQGIAGINGLQGIQGLPGTNGTNGINGLVGATGPQGLIGLTGLTGAAGPQGIQGSLGSQGLQGATGLTGAMGPQGPAGSNGSNGSNGLPGLPGLIGPQGLTGAAGAVGPQGLIGLTGLQGVAGPQGLIGLTGPTGLQGLQGLPGAQGSTGLTGAAGTVGPQGPIGLTGLTGAQGIQGLQGLNGIDGVNGTNGTNGTYGIQGLQGIAGTNGANGIDGAQGIPGLNGANGLDGINGTNGIDGVANIQTADNGLTLTGSNLQLGGVLTQDTVVDGNGGAFDLNLQDLKSFSLSGGGSGSTGYIGNSILTIAGSDQLNVITPNVNIGAATLGQVLTLVDTLTGQVEYTDLPAYTTSLQQAYDGGNTILLAEDVPVIITQNTRGGQPAMRREFVVQSRSTTSFFDVSTSAGLGILESNFTGAAQSIVNFNAGDTSTINFDAVNGGFINSGNNLTLAASNGTLTLDGGTQFNLKTPNVITNNATAGQVLTLIDPVTGQAEYANPTSVAQPNSLQLAYNGGNDILIAGGEDTPVNIYTPFTNSSNFNEGIGFRLGGDGSVNNPNTEGLIMSKLQGIGSNITRIGFANNNSGGTGVLTDYGFVDYIHGTRNPQLSVGFSALGGVASKTLYDGNSATTTASLIGIEADNVVNINGTNGLTLASNNGYIQANAATEITLNSPNFKLQQAPAVDNISNNVLVRDSVTGLVGLRDLNSLATPNFANADLTATNNRGHDFAGYTLDIANASNIGLRSYNGINLTAGGFGVTSSYDNQVNQQVFATGNGFNNTNSELTLNSNSLNFGAYDTATNQGGQFYSNLDNFGYFNYLGGFIFDAAANGDITFGNYTQTRNDTALTTPQNFLYTDSTGILKSAPISTISGSGSQLAYYKESINSPNTPPINNGNQTVAIGSGTEVNGNSNFAIGNNNILTTSSADNSIFGHGNSNTAGANSTILGNGNNQNGFFSTIAGFNNTQNGTGAIVGNFITGDSGTYTFGENITNNLNGTVQLGTSNANKLTIGQNGSVTFQGALQPNGDAGTTGQVLTSQGTGQAPIWSNPVSGGGTLNQAYNFGGPGAGNAIDLYDPCPPAGGGLPTFLNIFSSIKASAQVTPPPVNCTQPVNINSNSNGRFANALNLNNFDINTGVNDNLMFTATGSGYNIDSTNSLQLTAQNQLTLQSNYNSIQSNTYNQIYAQNQNDIFSGNGTRIYDTTGNGSGLFFPNMNDFTPTTSATNYLGFDNSGNVVKVAIPSGGSTYTAGTGLSLVGSEFTNTGLLSIATSTGSTGLTLTPTTTAGVVSQALSGTLAVTSGGTGLTSSTVGGLLVGGAGNSYNNLAIGTTGQVLTSQGTGQAPIWSNPTSTCNNNWSGSGNGYGTPLCIGGNDGGPANPTIIGLKNNAFSYGLFLQTSKGIRLSLFDGFTRSDQQLQLNPSVDSSGNYIPPNNDSGLTLSQLSNATPVSVATNYLGFDNTGKVVKVASPISGGGWNLTGNAGTIPGTNYLGTSDNQALVLKTNNVDRARIDTSGNFVINKGAVNPLLSSDFTVLNATGGFATAEIKGGSTGGAAILKFTNDANYQFAIGAGGGSNNSFANGSFVIRDQITGLNKIVVAPNGNVGIGDFSGISNYPTAKLQVDGVTANTSGLKFSKLTSASPRSVGQALGVDASGNVVTIAAGSGIGGTLNDAYNFGGPTLGRTINTDYLNPVVITSDIPELGAPDGSSYASLLRFSDIGEPGGLNITRANFGGINNYLISSDVNIRLNSAQNIESIATGTNSMYSGQNGLVLDPNIGLNMIDINFNSIFAVQNNGEIQANAYPITRDDTPFFPANNFLYTDAFGNMKSAPLSCILTNTCSGGGQQNKATPVAQFAVQSNTTTDNTTAANTFTMPNIFEQIVTFVTDITVNGTAFINNLVVQGTTIFQGRVTFGDADMSGVATIPAGMSEVRVNYTAPYTSTPVVTITGLGHGTLGYLETSDNAGFAIKIDTVAIRNLNFNWIAVNNSQSSNSAFAPVTATTPPPIAPPVVITEPAPVIDSLPMM
jgi:Collagen triple helix repeat (20 copies)